MTFRNRLFLWFSLFSALLVVTLGIAVVVSVESQLEREFRIRYETQMDTIGNAFSNLERVTGVVASNTVKYLVELDRRGAAASEEEIRLLKSKLNLAGIAVTNREGRFLRDTNTTPEQRTKTLFDFCSSYRNLLDQKERVELTPVLPGFPDLSTGYKFAMVASADGNRILEASVNLDFVSEVIRKALAVDPNILELGFYTASGHNMGSLKQGGEPARVKPGEKIEVTPGSSISPTGELLVVRKVAASQEECCECQAKGYTDGLGRYFYTIRAQVDRTPLVSALHRLERQFAIAMVVLLGFAFGISYALSRMLVSRLARLEAGIQRVSQGGDLSVRVDAEGRDEFAQLAGAFNGLLESLAKTQTKLKESERARGLAELAGDVASDIRSPLGALEVFLKSAHGLAEAQLSLGRAAVSRIEEIVRELLARHQAYLAGRDSTQIAASPSRECYLNTELSSAVNEVRERNSRTSELSIELDEGIEQLGPIFVRHEAVRLRSALRNALDSACEAFSGARTVEVKLVRVGEDVRVVVWSKKEGSAPVRSEVKFEGISTPDWFADQIRCDRNTLVLLLSADSAVHERWKARAAAIRTLHFTRSEELLKWYSAKDQPTAPRLIYLISHELAPNDPENGISLVKRLKIGRMAIVLTPYFEEELIRAQAVDFGFRLLPSARFNEVPIDFSET